MLNALALKDEQMGGLAEVLALCRRHILLLHGANLLDDQRIVALHAVVVDVEQILFVDEHATEVDSQHKAQVAGVAVYLYILDVANLVALSVNGAEATANLLVLKQQRVVGFVDVVGLEEVHVLIATQLAEAAEGDISLVACQTGDVCIRANNDDVVWATAVILLTACGVVGVVRTIEGTHHLHDEQAFLLHLALEHGIRHALCLGKHLLRVHTHHLLRGVDHIGDENRELVLTGLVEQLLEDGFEVGRRSIANALRGFKDIRVADELRIATRIGIDFGVHNIDAVVVATAGQLVQHTHNGGLERTVATGSIVGNHRAGTLQIEVHAERTTTGLDINLLRRTTILKEVLDVVLHLVDVEFAIFVEVLEVRFLPIEELYNLLPFRSIDDLVLIGNVEQHAIQLLLFATATGNEQHTGEECHEQGFQ